MRIILSAASLVALSACSNGPIEGWATGSTSVGPGTEFSQRWVERHVLVNRDQSLKAQVVQLELDSNGTAARLFVNDTWYDLTGPGDGSFTGPTESLISGFNTNDQVQIFHFAHDSNPAGDGYENTGYFVFGFRTDPDEMDGLSGSASYSGPAQMSVFLASEEYLASGDINLTADFGLGAIYGSVQGAAETGAPRADVTIGLNLDRARNISGNEFNGIAQAAIDLDAGSWDTQRGRFNGAFYGVGGSSVGGSFWGSYVNDAETTELFLQGAFATE